MSKELLAELRARYDAYEKLANLKWAAVELADRVNMETKTAWLNEVAGYDRIIGVLRDINTQIRDIESEIASRGDPVGREVFMVDGGLVTATSVGPNVTVDTDDRE